MKKTSRKTLIKKLDANFSLYMRLKYANKNGIVDCYTCGKSYHYKKIQNGHFISRKHYSTRWNENNCRPQCYSCNVMKYGEQYKFGVALNNERTGLANEMLERSRLIKKYTNHDLLNLIETYKQKIILLEKTLI
jgi:hypothetical protein